MNGLGKFSGCTAEMAGSVHIKAPPGPAQGHAMKGNTSCLRALLVLKMEGSLNVRWTVAPLTALLTDSVPLCVITRLPLIRPLILDVPYISKRTRAL